MRSLFRAFGLVLALAAFGCGESGVTEGTVPFKETNTSQFDQMKNQMIGNVKSKNYAKKQVGAAPEAPAEKNP